MYSLHKKCSRYLISDGITHISRRHLNFTYCLRRQIVAIPKSFFCDEIWRYVEQLAESLDHLRGAILSTLCQHYIDRDAAFDLAFESDAFPWGYISPETICELATGGAPIMN